MPRFEDLTDRRFGKLVVDKLYSKKPTRWLCKCDCGNSAIVKAGKLKSGYTKSCGCLKHTSKSRLDITNKTFNRLTAIHFIKSVRGKAYWLFRCSCGNEKIISIRDVISGRTKSCGCLHREPKPKNIEGSKIGKLTAVRYNQLTKKWLWLCECGNYKEIRLNDVVNYKSLSCGCVNIGLSGSRPEIEIKEYLENYFGLSAEKSKVLGGKEIDIYFPSLAFGVEYCGSPFHASENGVFRNITEDYHFKKFVLAKEKGIKLCTVFDWDIDVKRKILDSYNDIQCDWGEYAFITNQFPVTPNGYEFVKYASPLPHIDGKFTVYDCGYSVYRRIDKYERIDNN